MTALVSRYQNSSILDFIGAKNDGGGGDNVSYKMCQASVRLSPSTNFYRPTFTDQMPFLSANQQCQRTEEKQITRSLTQLIVQLLVIKIIVMGEDIMKWGVLKSAKIT